MAPNCLWLRASALGAAVAIVALLAAAGTGPIRNLTIAPDAEIVPLFDGMDAGRLHVRLSVQNANRALVFITNATEKTVNVALPKAAIGVHVLPQFNQGFFGNGASQNLQGLPGGLNANANQAQGVGGPMGPTGLFGNQQPAFPCIPPEWAEKPGLTQFTGFAAIPAGKTVQLQMRTVCLHYGRPDPQPSFRYKLIAATAFSRDPTLAQLLESYSPRVDPQAMQAAAWHVANNLGWDQLATLPDPRLRGTGARYFNARQLQQAQSLTTAVEAQVAQQETSRSLSFLRSLPPQSTPQRIVTDN